MKTLLGISALLAGGLLIPVDGKPFISLSLEGVGQTGRIFDHQTPDKLQGFAHATGS
ncbi:MAG TPA: hypothetical protein VGE39_21115 [Prosthecobacter sp.]